jgi:endonuclease-3
MLVKREMEIDSPVDAPLPETPKRRKVAQTPTPTTESPARTMETLRTGSSTRRSKRSANIEDVKPEIPITQLKRESESKPNGVGSMSTPKTTPKKALPLLALEKPHPEPAKWREQYRLIEHMRKGIIAPVDDM